MKNEMPYLDKEFSLSQVATLFSTNTRYLSNAINKSGETEKTTIEGIAIKSGFKNRSVFNTAFKSYTGVTPSFFINNYKSHL